MPLSNLHPLFSFVFRRTLLKQTGNTLIEYAIAAACVVVVLIVAFQAIGADLSQWFSGLKTDMHAQTQVTAAAQAKAEQAKAAHEAAQALKTPENITPQAAPACLSGETCASVAPYNPAQTAGANGIDLVDQYADIIKKLAEQAHAAPNSDLTFALMLDDLAEDGHYVADDERAVLTIYEKYGSSFDFSIRERYAATLNRAINYLNDHPQLLSAQDTQTLRTASGNITQQIVDFLGNSDPKAVTNTSINTKFTDAGGNQGATYVDKNASTICDTGGKNCN